MPRFRKKPVEVEAMQISADTHKPPHRHLDPNSRTIAEVSGWMIGHGCQDFKVSGPSPFGLDIPTLEGVMHASPGDWIIRGVDGEFYPCKPDIFARTYDEVEPLESSHYTAEGWHPLSHCHPDYCGEGDDK